MQQIQGVRYEVKNDRSNPNILSQDHYEPKCIVGEVISYYGSMPLLILFCNGSVCQWEPYGFEVGFVGRA